MLTLQKGGRSRDKQERAARALLTQPVHDEGQNPPPERLSLRKPCALHHASLAIIRGVMSVGPASGWKLKGYLRSLATFILGTMISLKMGT